MTQQKPKGPGGKPSKKKGKKSGKGRDNKLFLLSVVLSVFCFFSLGAVISAQASDLYEIEVTRKSQDLYEILYEGMYVKTRFCYEYVYFEDAILKIDSQYGYTIGEIIFENGSKCDVEKILR